MENIKMKTGLSETEEPSDNIKTFVVVFMAIIWRRVWITTAIYCEHNKINISKEVVLKALKYNIFSRAGIGNTLKLYIAKALGDGFLLPKFYEKSIYATRAVKLYKPAYAIVKLNSRKAELEFLKTYAFKVFETDNTMVNEVADESKDTLKDIETSERPERSDSDVSSDFVSDISISDENLAENNSDENNSDENNTKQTEKTPNPTLFSQLQERCKCKLCELIDSWDINIGLIYSEDPFKNVVMKGLSAALEYTS